MSRATYLARKERTASAVAILAGAGIALIMSAHVAIFAGGHPITGLIVLALAVPLSWGIVTAAETNQRRRTLARRNHPTTRKDTTR